MKTFSEILMWFHIIRIFTTELTLLYWSFKPSWDYFSCPDEEHIFYLFISPNFVLDMFNVSKKKLYTYYILIRIPFQLDTTNWIVYCGFVSNWKLFVSCHRTSNCQRTSQKFSSLVSIFFEKLILSRWQNTYYIFL